VNKNTHILRILLLWLAMVVFGGCNLVVGNYQQADGSDAGVDAVLDAVADDGTSDPDDGSLDGDAEDGDSEELDAGPDAGDAEDGGSEDGDDGSADDGGCTDECGPVGVQECIDITSYHVCEDADGCLKWGLSISCECQQCIAGNCEELESGWQLLGEPTAGCGQSPCEMWDDFCTTPDRQYMILREGPDFIRWYEPCNIFDAGLPTTSIECGGVGRLLTINSNGVDIYEGDSENFGSSSTWSIYHREFFGNCLGVSYNGCGESSCTLVDYFNLTPTSRYFVRQQDLYTTRWFGHCRIRRGGVSPPGQQLVCRDARQARVSFHSESTENITDYDFTGSWTFCLEYANSSQLYQGPTPGCGAQVCALWDDFDLDSSFLYDVRWHAPNVPEESTWFGKCVLNSIGQTEEVLTCLDVDDQPIRLRPHQAESYGENMTKQWSLHRIPLP
jgi:hypothetical protein